MTDTDRHRYPPAIADDDRLYPPPTGQSTRSVSAEIEAIATDAVPLLV